MGFIVAKYKKYTRVFILNLLKKAILKIMHDG